MAIELPVLKMVRYLRLVKADNPISLNNTKYGQIIRSFWPLVISEVQRLVTI